MKRFETGERVAITHTLSAQIFLRNATRRKFCAFEKKTVEHPDLFTPARDVVPIKHTAPSRAEVDANMAKWTNLAKTLAAEE